MTNRIGVLTGAWASERLADCDCLACGIALNTENPPLNADMQKLLGRIKSVTATPAEPKPDNAEGASHILLSAYTGNTRN
jgi:hypothetical protein